MCCTCLWYFEARKGISWWESFAETLAGAMDVDWKALSEKLPTGKDAKGKEARKKLWKRADPNGNGYPIVSPEQIIEHNVEGLLLSSEPHEFSKQEGEAICDAVEALGGKRPWTKCIDGEALTWFGSHTLQGLRIFIALCKDLKTSDG